MANSLWTSLLSGLFGAVLTIIVSEGIKYLYRRRDQKSLLRAIVSECQYNLLILDEVTKGTVNAHGSFKRMSVEFFKTIRQQSVVYALPKKFLNELSHVIINLELFNREADFVFQGNQNKTSFVGVFGKTPVYIAKDSHVPNVNATVVAACEGVKVSLKKVLEIAQDELGEEDDEEN